MSQTPVSQQSLYIQEPLVFEFEASLVEKTALPGGRFGVVLDRTYFYPTGGGQEHDTGQIASAQVLDVYRSADKSQVIHVVDRDIPLALVSACIDADRRIRHMQHHTGQHLLSQCFLRLFEARTLSANINGYTPSTLDLESSLFSDSGLEKVENLVNEFIFQNLPVKSYFVSQSESELLPVRKLDVVHDQVRIVEIDSFDFSACAGTHCTHTGSIGLLKITKSERQNDKTRIHFVAGKQAFENYKEVFDTVSRLSSLFSLHPRDLEGAVRQQVQSLSTAQKELAGTLHELVKFEAVQLQQEAESIGSHRIIVKSFENRPLPQLRQLAVECRQAPRTVAVLVAVASEKISLVVATSQDSGVQANELLGKMLQHIGGRGGGDAAVAQGGGSGTRAQLVAIMNDASHLIRSLLPANDRAG